MKRAFVFGVSAGMAALTAGAGFAQPASPGGPARYDMRAGTVSGVGAQGGRGGMAMMMGGGGGNAVQHELQLRLGSGRAADRGAPKADHFMPPAAQLGRSVALVSPREERLADELPQRPKGRMLIYWGCGEHAPKGQPVVIDFSKLAAGQIPPGLWSSTILRDWGPTAVNSRSFARWPAEDGKYVRSDSSLPGPHRVTSNFAPEISFTLANDFMQPLRSRTMNLPGGAKNLMWTGIPQATGYLATLFGGSMNDRGDMGDMVMWSARHANSAAALPTGSRRDRWRRWSATGRFCRRPQPVAPSRSRCCVTQASSGWDRLPPSGRKKTSPIRRAQPVPGPGIRNGLRESATVRPPAGWIWRVWARWGAWEDTPRGVMTMARRHGHGIAGRGAAALGERLAVWAASAAAGSKVADNRLA